MLPVSRIPPFAAAVVALPAAALAATYYPHIFDPGRGGSICYARSYSAAFLKAHPGVKLTWIWLERRSRVADGVPNSRKLFALNFGAITKAESYSAFAKCKPQGKTISCDIEADGGQFTVLRAGRGVIIKTRRIEIEGMFKELDISSKKGKPARSFSLTGHGPKTCDEVFD